MGLRDRIRLSPDKETLQSGIEHINQYLLEQKEEHSDLKEKILAMHHLYCQRALKDLKGIKAPHGSEGRIKKVSGFGTDTTCHLY